ncbi:phage tail protein [Pseudomonas sp. EZ-C24]|uniref:phage tail protein n=1 Tax=Pseudomonas sp. EZ-C24 TaxID=2753617 RepID=UPI00165E165E|nr:tail fiber protein [Pseudomonas sp. EZ-C24]
MSDPFLGEIRMFAGTYAPRGWALCQGQLLPIVQNQALFSLLGTYYGGNGTTNFALPDLRGRAAIGTGQGPALSQIDLGESSGSEAVTLTANNIPQVPVNLAAVKATVAVPAFSGDADSNLPASNRVLAKSVDADGSGVNVSIFSESAADTALTAFQAPLTGSATAGGSSLPISVRNPSLGVNMIIAVEGIYPSRN